MDLQKKVSTFEPKKGAGCSGVTIQVTKEDKVYEVLKKTPNLEAAILRDAEEMKC